MFEQWAGKHERPHSANSRHVLYPLADDSEAEVEITELWPMLTDLHKLVWEQGHGHGLEMESEVLQIGHFEVRPHNLYENGNVRHYRKRHVGMIG